MHRCQPLSRQILKRYGFWLDELRTRGIDGFAIPHKAQDAHNAGGSFEEQNFFGKVGTLYVHGVLPSGTGQEVEMNKGGAIVGDHLNELRSVHLRGDFRR